MAIAWPSPSGREYLPVLLQPLSLKELSMSRSSASTSLA
jgi:hypothetical protein